MSEPLYFNHTQDTSKNLEFIINQFKDFSSSNNCQSLLKQNNLSVIDSFSKWKMERIKEEDEKKKKNNIKKSSPIKQSSDILIQHMLNSKKYEQDKKKELEKKEKDKEKDKEREKEDDFIKSSITNPNDHINIVNNSEKYDKLENLKMNQEISSKIIMEIDDREKKDEDIFDSSIEKKNSEYGKDEDDIFKLDDDNYDDIFDNVSHKDVFENSRTQKVISPKQSFVSNNHDVISLNNSQLSNINTLQNEYMNQEGNNEKEKQKEQVKPKELNKNKDINKILNNKTDNEKTIGKVQVIEKDQEESQNGYNKISIFSSNVNPSQKVLPSNQLSQQIEKKETPKAIVKIDDLNDNMLMKLQKIEKELSFMDSESDMNTSQNNLTIQNKPNNKNIDQSNILREKDIKNHISPGMSNYNLNNIKKIINEKPKIHTPNNMTAPKQIDKIPGNSTNTTQTNVNHSNQIAVLNNKRVLLDEEEEEEIEKERMDDIKSKSDTNSFRNKLVEISDTRIKIFFDSDIKEHMNQKSVTFIKNNEDTLIRDKKKNNEVSLPLKEEKNHIKTEIKRNPIKIKSPENVKIDKFSNSSLLANKTTNALEKNNSMRNKALPLTNQNQSDYSKNRNKNNIINEKSETSKESINFSTRTYVNDNQSLFNKIESLFKALKKAIQNLIIEELDKEDFTLSFEEILTNIKVLKEKDPSPINTFIKCCGFMNMCLKVINSCPIGRSCKNSLFSYVSLFI